ncbi:MAG TPA: DUF4388 domain-containing protein [Nitrospiria bacterium]|nr:DUF4388 domain-containing protein [Nitrospiria bacterium]
MALEGSLKDFGLADILQLIYLQKKTGILTMKNASTESRVLFEKGLIVQADTSNLEGIKKIGEILARSNKITEDQLKEALAKQQHTKDKIGLILIEMGAIQKEDLVKALDLHVKEAVLSLFQWKEGHYSFEPSEISLKQDYLEPVNTEFLIMEGVRRIDEWPFIEKKIPNLEIVFEKNSENMDRVRVAKSEEDPDTDKVGEQNTEVGIKVSQGEMNIFNLVDGQQDVRHLIEIGNMGEFETCKALSNLLTAGLISPKLTIRQQQNELEETDKKEERIPWLTSRKTASGLVLVFCLIIILAGGRKVMKSVDQTESIIGLYSSIAYSNTLQHVGYSILTFYYRNHRLPRSLDALAKDNYPVTDLRYDLEMAKIEYEPQPSTSTFTLTYSGQE